MLGKVAYKWGKILTLTGSLVHAVAQSYKRNINAHQHADSLSKGSNLPICHQNTAPVRHLLGQSMHRSRSRGEDGTVRRESQFTSNGGTEPCPLFRQYQFSNPKWSRPPAIMAHNGAAEKRTHQMRRVFFHDPWRTI